MAKNWASWFEIPVSDFDRAKTFYEVIFDMNIHAMDLGELKMGIFPSEGGGGAICKGKHYQPGETGPVIYLNAEPDLQLGLDRIPLGGGTIIQPKKQISENMGYMALFNDTEGNRIALHSMH